MTAQFQHRHYETMARWLAAQHHQCVEATSDETLWLSLVNSAVDLFITDNPRFKADKFVNACDPRTVALNVLRGK